MATYTQACSQVGSFSYAKYFTLYVVLTNRDGNPATNKSYIDYNVYCRSSGSGSISANHDLYFSLNGNVIKNEKPFSLIKRVIKHKLMPKNHFKNFLNKLFNELIFI